MNTKGTSLIPFVTAILLGTLSLPAHAAQINTIADINLAALTFEVDDFDTAPSSITGSSNGIGYEVVADSIFLPFSNLTGSQSYNELPNSYDDLHLGTNFSITFDSPVQAVLFALANDNATGDGPDFGITPADSTGITLTGTKLGITDIQGSLALLTFAVPTTSLIHMNDNLLDGFDVTFFAFEADRVAAVPLPAALPLFGASLAVLGFAARRRSPKAEA